MTVSARSAGTAACVPWRHRVEDVLSAQVAGVSDIGSTYHENQDYFVLGLAESGARRDRVRWRVALAASDGGQQGVVRRGPRLDLRGPQEPTIPTPSSSAR